MKKKPPVQLKCETAKIKCRFSKRKNVINLRCPPNFFRITKSVHKLIQNVKRSIIGEAVNETDSLGQSKILISDRIAKNQFKYPYYSPFTNNNNLTEEFLQKRHIRMVDNESGSKSQLSKLTITFDEMLQIRKKRLLYKANKNKGEFSLVPALDNHSSTNDFQVTNNCTSTSILDDSISHSLQKLNCSDNLKIDSVSTTTNDLQVTHNFISTSIIVLDDSINHSLQKINCSDTLKIDNVFTNKDTEHVSPTKSVINLQHEETASCIILEKDKKIDPEIIDVDAADQQTDLTNYDTNVGLNRINFPDHKQPNVRDSDEIVFIDEWKPINLRGHKKPAKLVNVKKKRKRTLNSTSDSDISNESESDVVFVGTQSIGSVSGVKNYMSCSRLGNKRLKTDIENRTLPNKTPGMGTATNALLLRNNNNNNNITSIGGSNSVDYNICNTIKIKKSGLRDIIIDGSNVAMGHGNGVTFSVEGLQIAINFFLKKNHKVIAFVPQYRSKYTQSSNYKLLNILNKKQLVIFTPSREVDGRRITPYDDRYIIQYANACEGIVVSNDNFRDILQEKPQWRNTIEKRILMYTWINNVLIFPEDPLGRNGPKLDQFLRFP